MREQDNVRVLTDLTVYAQRYLRAQPLVRAIGKAMIFGSNRSDRRRPGASLIFNWPSCTSARDGHIATDTWQGPPARFHEQLADEARRHLKDLASKRNGANLRKTFHELPNSSLPARCRPEVYPNPAGKSYYNWPANHLGTLKRLLPICS
jgi:hypothetical protein